MERMDQLKWRYATKKTSPPKAVAQNKVDSTPLEGFDHAALDALLAQPAKGLKSVAFMPPGYRQAGQGWRVKLEKVRVPRQQFAVPA